MHDDIGSRSITCLISQCKWYHLTEYLQHYFTQDINLTIWLTKILDPFVIIQVVQWGESGEKLKTGNLLTCQTETTWQRHLSCIFLKETSFARFPEWTWFKWPSKIYLQQAFCYSSNRIWQIRNGFQISQPYRISWEATRKMPFRSKIGNYNIYILNLSP